MLRTILVPLDGSPFGEHALPVAVSVARAAGAEVRLVHVHAPSDPRHPDWHLAPEQRSDPSALAGQRAYLDGIAAKLTAAGVQTSPALVEGQTVSALNRHTAGCRVDLIVMTTHGRGPLSRAWLGSVADSLLRVCNVPVLLVRPTEAPVDRTARVRLGRILVPLDGSKHAEAILGPVLELGAESGRCYTLLRVVSPVPALGYDVFSYVPAGADAALIEQMRRNAVTYLDGVAERLRASGLDVRTRVVIHPSVAAAILQESETRDCDMIAIETHGRAGASRLLLGSVADKVIRGADVPVFVHRSPEA